MRKRGRLWAQQLPFFFRIDFLFTSTSSEVMQIPSQPLMLWFNWFLNSNHLKTCNKKWEIKENQSMKLSMPKTFLNSANNQSNHKKQGCQHYQHLVMTKEGLCFLSPFLFLTSNIFSFKNLFRDKDLFVFSLPSWSHRCVAETKNNVPQLAL